MHTPIQYVTYIQWSLRLVVSSLWSIQRVTRAAVRSFAFGCQAWCVGLWRARICRPALFCKALSANAHRSLPLCCWADCDPLPWRFLAVTTCPGDPQPFSEGSMPIAKHGRPHVLRFTRRVSPGPLQRLIWSMQPAWMWKGPKKNLRDWNEP